ncbi:hypothetical protein, partial [Ralstonia pseudosolanacearum]
MLDVTSLISGAGFVRAGVGATRAVRMASTAAAFATDAAVQESLLHSMDASRSREESFMNIGVGTFLGAGLGAVFRHLPPDSALRTGHPDNPLHPDNFDKVEVNSHYVGQL